MVEYGRRNHRRMLLPGFTLAALVCLLYAPPSSAPALQTMVSREEGIRLLCPASQQADAIALMTNYLAREGIDLGWVHATSRHDRLLYTLAAPAGDTSTLDLHGRPSYGLSNVPVRLPSRHGKMRHSFTVSRTEILLALMQHGRVTDFSGADCGVLALQRQVELRQNIVAWAWELSWTWPDGEAAEWNRRYWDEGTPRPHVSLLRAVQDAFDQQTRYAMGCYTATKLTLIQAALDYYHRVRPDASALARLEARLKADGEPLQNIEPGRLWDFEADFDPAERHRPGKMTKMMDGVAAKNFVPGDWVVFVNTDPISYAKTGYEGSNAIYLGGGRFDDYYDDHHHAYTYEEKLDEVYQWRHGVFSRIRDRDKRHPLDASDFERLSTIPSAGGLVLDVRVVPGDV